MLNKKSKFCDISIHRIDDAGGIIYIEEDESAIASESVSIGDYPTNTNHRREKPRKRKLQRVISKFRNQTVRGNEVRFVLMNFGLWGCTTPFCSLFTVIRIKHISRLISATMTLVFFSTIQYSVISLYIYFISSVILC